MLNAQQSDIFTKAVAAMSGMMGKPLLYGPDGKPVKSADIAFRRSAARRTGSMKNWIPRRLLGRQSEAMEREAIVERSVDLAQNDPHAAGIVDNFATTVIGSGLSPHPTIENDFFQDLLSREEIGRIQRQQRVIYRSWFPFADAGERMSFGMIQYLVMRSIIEYGEYFVLLPMIDDPIRPYSLACQVINPLRVKTPADKLNQKNIRDGVEIGLYGQAIAYWIKKADPFGRSVPDTSANFMRIPVRAGHRWKVLHGFFVQEPEQVRGIPFFAPAMKYFRDFNDLLDAELVSSIVTAALSYFIETGSGADPTQMAWNMAQSSEDYTDGDGNSKERRYEEIVPGQIMYGSEGEKPHMLAAGRPGVTFEPFTKTIKKSIAMSLNIPYPVLFKDVEGVNFAGFRSAMLDAWRVYSTHRVWLGNGFCQRVYTMLQEEAYLRGDLQYKKFYTHMGPLTRAEWRGMPKGDIEPIKAVQADVIAINNKLKTREEAIAERGGELREVFGQLEEENELMETHKLNPIADELVVDTEEDDGKK
jgi:lambda family phage portal protein